MIYAVYIAYDGPDCERPSDRHILATFDHEKQANDYKEALVIKLDWRSRFYIVDVEELRAPVAHNPDIKDISLERIY